MSKRTRYCINYSGTRFLSTEKRKLLNANFLMNSVLILFNLFPLCRENGYTGYDYTYLYCSLFVDTDECTSGTHNCHSSLASCTNTAGSFSCTCNSPYVGDGRSCYISGDNSPNIAGRSPFTKPLFTLVRSTLLRGGGGGIFK